MKKILELNTDIDGRGVYEHIGGEFSVFSNPFDNCQIYSIANVNYIFDQRCNNDEEAVELLKSIQAQINKTQLIIDVNRTYEPRVEKFFPTSEIIFKQQYTNNTGSLMTMYLLQMREYTDPN